ncbi:MAG: SulP family inorganic anion transporter [Flavisolibacter sp.]|nr:SulP family inorganic anion transporter [Flavisolibacter sp.]
MKTWQLSRGNIFGGLTAGIVALPLALAFGVQSGLGPAAGLYGAIILGFFAALFGGTNTQISGPTGPMTVVSAATIADFIVAGGNLQAAIGAIVACFVLAGILQIIMGVLKIGTLIRFIPYPVISGFMSGIGVIIILLQLFPAMGQKSPLATVDVVTTIGPALQNMNLWALFYAALTIAIIYLFPKITKAVPSTLVALMTVTVLSVFIKADVPVIGSIPEGLPKFLGTEIIHIPAHVYSEIFAAAITLAALGSIDSLLTSVIADNVTKTKHNSNRELVGQGIGNTISGLFGGIPGAGATMRTLVNIRSGGKTKVSGMLHSVTLAVILLGVGRYAALIPNSVLAGVLITVGIGILDYRGFRHIAKVPRSDAVIMIIVLLVTVFLDLLTAVGIGMVMAALLFMKKMSDIMQERSKVYELSSFINEIGWEKDNFPPEWKSKVFIKHIEGPLFFGFASGFQRMAEQLPDVKYVLIRMENVPFIDQTGLYALEEAILSLEQRGIDVLLTGVQEQPQIMLRRIRIIPDLIPEDNIYNDYKKCAGWVKKKLQEKEEVEEIAV